MEKSVTTVSKESRDGNEPAPFVRPDNAPQVTISNGVTIAVPAEGMKDHIENVLEFKMRPDDIIVASYPKSGTTWVQEVVWLICNEADVKKAKASSLFNRYCYLDMQDGDQFDVMRGATSLTESVNSEPRFIKTHLPFELQPYEQQAAPRGKIIYIVRNPKDVCVSYYHWHRTLWMMPDPKTWNEFLESFRSGRVSYGSWFDHVSKWWQVHEKRKDSIYIVQYETMKKNLKEAVMQLANFLGKQLSDDQINSIVQHCSFKEMSKNKSTNWSEFRSKGLIDENVSKFMRKGEVGDWKNHFTVSQNEAFDELLKTRLNDCDLKIEYELTDC